MTDLINETDGQDRGLRLPASSVRGADGFAAREVGLANEPEQQHLTEISDELCLRLADGTLLLVPRSLDSITTYVILEQEKWFEKEVDFVVPWLRADMTAIDIGANVGIYSIPMARAVGPNGRVFAYEPAAVAFGLLSRNKALNNADNLITTREAVSDHAGSGCLSFHGSAESSRLDLDDLGETVTITCLDDAAKEHGWTSIDFVKIDAERKGGAIIQGGGSVFALHSPLVMFESDIDEPTSRSPECCFLKALGYGLFRLLAGAPVLVPLDTDRLDPCEANLFAAKPDRAASMARDGWLVEVLPEWSPNDRDRAQALEPLRQLRCAPAFPGLLTDEVELDPDYRDCLAAFAVWRSADTDLPKRCAALDFAWRGLLALNQSEARPTFARMSTLARVASEAGQRSVSIKALRVLFDSREAWALHLETEPFWLASKRFDNLLPDGDIREWIIGSAVEQLELSGHFSSVFSGATPALAWLSGRRFVSNEIMRRGLLLAARSGSEAALASWLLSAAPYGSEKEPWLSEVLFRSKLGGAN